MFANMSYNIPLCCIFTFMKTEKLLLTFYLLFVPFMLTSAENNNFYFRKIQVDDGLSENTVFCILQDSKGYMWFGTKDGLSRFDGKNFRIFRNSEDNPVSLGNNFVRAMLEVNEDCLFIGTDVGLYYMDVVHEAFYFVESKTADGTSMLTAVSSLYKDQEDCLWIGTMAQGVFKYNLITKELQKVLSSEFDLAGHAVWSIYGDKSGTIWLGSRLGLLRYNSSTNRLEAIKGLAYRMDTYDHEILCIHEDEKGNLWLGTWGEGVKFYNKQNFEEDIYQGKNDPVHYISKVRAIHKYDDQHLLFGSDDGLFLFHPESKESRRIDIPQSKYSMSDQNVYSIAGDRENGIWIGTYFGGVNYLNIAQQSIETYYPDITPGNLSGKAVSQFCEDKKGNLWIATEDGGINYFDVKTKQITRPIQTTYYNIHTLLLTGDELWIGTFSRGIDVYNIETGKLVNYRKHLNDENTLDDDCIFSLYKTKNGDIYAGTPVGLNKYNPENGSFTRIPEAAGFIYDIKEDERDNLWVATYWSGAKRLNMKTGIWVHYDTVQIRNNPIIGSKLTGIYIDNQKRLIFSSEGRGIFIYDYETDNFKNISEKDGLPNNVVYGVLDDMFGNWWVSCNKGIVCFNVSNPKEYKLFNKNDGLQSNQFNYKSSFKARDGKFYFGGINGFNCFYPQDLTKLHNSVVPQVDITGLDLLDNSDPAMEKEIQILLNKKQKIVLPYDKSSFTISYVSLSFQSQSKNRYAYKLEGDNNGWIHAGNNNQVTYINLSPGKYLFKVKASNNNEVWNEEGAEIEIEILPPPWLALPAKLIYLLIFILACYLLISYYVKKNRKTHLYNLEVYKAEQEKLSFKSKINFFTNIAHEIRTPVSLIKAPLEEILVSADGNETTKMNLSIIEKNCNRLNVLINQLLDFRKMDSMKYIINPERVNLNDYLKELFDRFRKTAQSNKIEFTLNLLPGTGTDVISDSDALTKVVGNLLTNALKFTKDKIILSLERNEDESYTIRVEDNGPGVPDEYKKLIFDPFYRIGSDSDKKGTGIGLSLVKNLAELLKGKVEVEDADLTGAIFKFTFTGLPEEITVKEKVEERDTAVPDEEKQKSEKINFILVVDDNSEITEFIRSCLSNDYYVETALHASDAWKKLEEKNVDLIISDIMMPDIDGISFTKSIKANLSYSHIPVILLSAKTENAVKIEGLRSGAEVFIEKPFSTSFLRAQIVSLLENRKTILESFKRSPLASYSILATNKNDEAFLKKLNEEIEKNLSDETFSVESLTDMLNISRSHFQRKLKGICGATPGEYLRDYRLKRACRLLLETDMRINEVAFYVGFNSASYFTKAFMKSYKMSPKEFIQKNQGAKMILS